MYASWLGLEGPYLVEQMQRKPKPIVWFSGEGHEPAGPRYRTTAIFIGSKAASSKERTVFGGASFDPKYLKEKFFRSFSRSLLRRSLTGSGGTHAVRCFTS